jgi:hypothetical protein
MARHRNRPARPDRHRRTGLTQTERDAIRAAVAALPPLIDEQIDALCEVINNQRVRRRRTRTADRPDQPDQ